MVGERRRLRRRRSVGRGVARAVAPALGAAAVVVIVIGAVAQIGPASGPDRRIVDRSFAVLAAPIVVRSNASGSVLTRLLTHGPSLDRVTFFSDLASIATGADADARRFADLTPPSPGGAAAALCGTTLDDRATAAARVRAALERLLGGTGGQGGGNEAGAAHAVVEAGTELEAADSSWAACRRSLLRAPGSARLSPSTWVSDRGLWTNATVGSFVASLAGSGSLAPAHRLTLLALSTDPAAVPGGSGVNVLPATSTLSVHIVVANSGNVDEQGVKVVVSAVAQGTVPQRPPVQVTTDIGVGTSVALSPPALRVRPGTSYVLDITATPQTAGAAVSTSEALRISSVIPTSTTTTATTTARSR